MAKCYSRSYSKSSSSSSSRSYSSARAHQKVGQSFGGYTKVQTTKGTFRMKPTSKQLAHAAMKQNSWLQLLFIYANHKNLSLLQFFINLSQSVLIQIYPINAYKHHSFIFTNNNISHYLQLYQISLVPLIGSNLFKQ